MIIMTKEPLLVSACLLGIECRYNGEIKVSENVAALADKYTLIPVCPEILGGLKTPRPAAERRGNYVFNKEGFDVTEHFLKGAEETAKMAAEHGCKQAVLKENSPSCGCGVIYDGTFSSKRIKGNGVAAEFLLKMGVNIVGENNLEKLK